MLLSLTCQLPTLYQANNVDLQKSESRIGPGSICYISSEGRLPITRIDSLSEGLLERHPQSQEHQIDVDYLRNNIHFVDCNDVEALEHTLSYLLPALIDRLATRPPAPLPPFTPSSDYNQSPNTVLPPPLLPLRLIILDSLAALIRVSFESSGAGLSLRSVALATIADKLKSLAVAHNLAILVVNQVTDAFNDPWGVGDSWTRAEADAAAAAEDQDDKIEPDLDQLATSEQRKRKLAAMNWMKWDGNGEGVAGGKVVLDYSDQSKWFNGSSPSFNKEAALGLVWSNCIDTRIMLSRTHRYRLIELSASQPNGTGGPRKGLIRRMHLIFGTNAPGGGRVDYVVGEREVRGLKDQGRLVGHGQGRKRIKMENGESNPGSSPDIDGDDYGDDGWMTQVPEQEWEVFGENAIRSREMGDS